VPGTESLADELADPLAEVEGEAAAEGEAVAVPEPVFTTTLFSVPLAAVTVTPADGSASWLPLPGLIWIAAAASEARDTGVGVLFVLAVLCPPPLEHAASTRPSTATTTAPIGFRRHWPGVPSLPRTLVLHGRVGKVVPRLPAGSGRLAG
jgi:hypothetical protein